MVPGTRQPNNKLARESGAKRRSNMKVQEIKEIAQRMAIQSGKLKKSELIRVIQRTEGNCECFDSGRSAQCGQQGCLWADDCN